MSTLSHLGGVGGHITTGETFWMEYNTVEKFRALAISQSPGWNHFSKPFEKNFVAREDDA
jgi:hypothetical protein